LVRRTREEALQTRERILNAAIDVFHERGVARPSLTDIAHLAGVTRGAVYGHFENKTDLFTALVARVPLPADVVCDADSNACRRDPLGTLRESWVGFLRQAATNTEHHRILEIIFHRCELVAESGLIQQRMHEGHTNSIARMTELISAAVDKGQLPADLDVPRAVNLLHSSLIGILNEWLFEPEAYDLAAEAERFVDALLTMIATAPTLRRPA